MKNHVLDRWIVAYQVSPRHLRVADIHVLKRHASQASRLVADALSVPAATVVAQMGDVIDPLIVELRHRASTGSWPPIPPGLAAEAASMGARIAIVERDQGLYRDQVTHPAVHIALCYLAAAIVEDEPAELAQLPLEAAYLSIRSNCSVQAVLA